jgi:prepilin-type N-terminal cleavage/methylation domain-containing protein/prepilin-type processing-associated H-X9-DG protein
MLSSVNRPEQSAFFDKNRVTMLALLIDHGILLRYAYLSMNCSFQKKGALWHESRCPLPLSPHARIGGVRCLSGFTLVELLVVVAVVGLLGALIFMAIGSARLRADQAIGAARMRAIGLAIIQYAADRQGMLPGPLTPSAGPVRGGGELGTGQALVNRIAGYMGGENYREGEIVTEFANPAVLRQTRNPAIAHYYLFFNLRDAEGRFWGVCPWGYPGHTTYPRPIRLTAIENPGYQIVLKDNDRELVNTDRPRGWPPPGGIERPIYKKARNVLFFDGHVESEPVD